MEIYEYLMSAPRLAVCVCLLCYLSEPILVAVVGPPDREGEEN